MTINIKTSETSHQLIRDYSNRLRIKQENVIARVAFGYSLSKSRQLNLKDIRDSKGKEYREDTFFGKSKTQFISLICQLYGIHRSDINLPKYVKMHIDDGLELMSRFFESNPNHTIFDFLIEAIDKGVEGIEHSNNPFKFVENTNGQFPNKSYNSQLWKIVVGADAEGEKIVLEPNDTKKYTNSHMAIAGTTGSGKTQLALELIVQIVEQSKGDTNYIYLDFKGLNSEDEKKLHSFFKRTKTEFVNAPHKRIPINPLSFIDNVNENNKKLGINKFVDYIVEYSNAGNAQKQQLRDAVRAVFAAKKNGKYPTLTELHNEIPNHFQKIPNVVTEIIEGLSDPPIFSEETNKDFLNGNYYFSLSADLHQSIRFTSIFLIINYIYNTFMAMPDAPVENGVRCMRYVMLIDEAQVIFRDKKAKLVLQQILEQIRSKGVAIILVAQNVDEFDQPQFSFSSLCEIGFLLKTADLTATKKMQKFLGLADREVNLLVRSLEKMIPGQGVSNIREFKRGELFNISQFYTREQQTGL